MAQVFSSKPVVTTPVLAVGDDVMWKGIPLTVVEVNKDGTIRAHSLTMQLVVGSATELTKVE